MSSLTLYDSSRLYEQIDRLGILYPTMRTQIIGASVLGKPLVELQLGSGKKGIHWNGAFHANEWITTPLLMNVLEVYGTEICMILNENDAFLSIVPMVNPDGVDLVHYGSSAAAEYRSLVESINKKEQHKTYTSWKANIRGIDLNNQFPAGWELEKQRKPKQPSFRDFPGYSPLSEPESIAMYELTNCYCWHRMLCFHSQGEVIYWGYNHQEPDRSHAVAGELGACSAYIPVHGVDSHAGYKDWFIHHFQQEGYTIEVGKGINPLPTSSFSTYFYQVKEICLKSVQLN
ncbi:M14 family metallocarboxypeptidase [Pontibacillus salicampi]|uniref:M14 family metallocarboxypeptidase n=1 Tax=Pontibacillus salicampi TaxID=1449801 RepID=A0ABV6LJX0_9BACI